jgi:hypothetical protein
MLQRRTWHLLRLALCQTGFGPAGACVPIGARHLLATLKSKSLRPGRQPNRCRCTTHMRQTACTGIYRLEAHQKVHQPCQAASWLLAVSPAACPCKLPANSSQKQSPSSRFAAAPNPAAPRLLQSSVREADSSSWMGGAHSTLRAWQGVKSQACSTSCTCWPAGHVVCCLRCGSCTHCKKCQVCGSSMLQVGRAVTL